jgi:cold shock CspA family protein
MRQQGTVVTYFDDRGFGFIQPDDSSGELYFHARRFKGAPPAVGVRVEFELVPPSKIGKPEQAGHIVVIRGAQ